MQSVHGHDVLNMMLEADTPWQRETLILAIQRRFGEDTRFHTCSQSGLSAAELVDFLEKKGSLFRRKVGLIPRRKKSVVTDNKGALIKRPHRGRFTCEEANAY